MDLERLKAMFADEAKEALEALEESLLALGDTWSDPEEIAAAFRAAHTIKGGAAAVGLEPISEFTHLVETILDQFREGTRHACDEVNDALLQSIDTIRTMLEQAQDGEPDPATADACRKTLEGLLAGSEVSEGEIVPPQRGARRWRIGFAPGPALMESGNDPVCILATLHELGTATVTCHLGGIPALGEIAPETCHLSWTIDLVTESPKERIDEVFSWVEGLCELTIESLAEDAEAPTTDAPAPIAAPPPAAAAPEVPDGAEPAPAPEKAEAPRPESPAPKKAAPAPAENAKPKSARAKSGGGSIRVDTEKIDSLINQVGELVITQSMLSQLGENFDMQDLARLSDGLTQLQRHTREIQESVMRIRMLPIGTTFNRFPRVVRDLSHQLGKEVELKVSGEQTELDKTVLEQIADPLVHLLRNSIDHGVEAPEERVAKGKERRGTVSLNAFHHGGNIVIEISDDGKGIDADVLQAKARDKGLVKEGESLSRERVLELIFHPGFSTAEKLTDVSGRGVGMDVVRRNITSLGGNISIETETGQGTTFTIRLPLTLAILDGQTVRVGEQRYIFPLVSISESIQLTASDVYSVAGKAEVFRLRDRYLPLLRLYELFGTAEAVSEVSEGLVVVVESNESYVGILVDDLMAHQQIVIKSLESNYERIEGLSGATILGDGSVALILDVPGLVSLAMNQMPDEAADLAALATA